jgi:PAS domain S-box-containing protein
MKTATDKRTPMLLDKRLLKVLLVDDEATDRIAVEWILRTCSSPAEFVVESVVRLSEAIKKLTEKQYDVVLLDLELPDSSGIEILQRVIKVAPDIPVVVLTERDDEQAGFSALKDGATDYLVKDLPLDVVLVRTIVYAIQRKKIQMQSLKLAHDNNERMKELNCLYGISNLVETPGISLEEMLEKTARLIPAGWQYPGIACARIIFEGREYKTDNFKPSKWAQSADITLQGQKVGTVEVCYTEERPQSDEGPFLEEKRDLIDSIGERLGRIIGSKRAEEKISNSQALLQRIINLLPVRVFWKDKSLRYLGCNEIFAKDAGKNSPEDMVGSDDFQTNWKEQAKSYRDDDQSVIKSGKPKLNFEEFQTTPKGDRICLKTSKVPLIDLQGNTIGLLGTYEDVTERKQAEELLRASETLFKTMFNEAPLGIALIDSLTGHIYSVNPMFAKIAGRTMEEMTHIDWMSITHPDDVQKDLDNMVLLNAGKIPGFQIEKRYLHNDGTYVWINMTIAPIYVEDKAHPRHLCMIEDITERKQVEETLRESEERYRSLFENMLNGFAYCQMLFEDGRPQDFIYLSVNKAFESLTGLKEVVEKKVSDVIPGIRESDNNLLEIYGRVALTGKPEFFEMFIKSLNGWYSISVYSPKKGFFIAVFDVITERKQAEEALREKSALLVKIINSVPDFIFAKDTKLRTIICNEAYASAVGRKPEEMIGHTDIENGWNPELVCGNPTKGIRGFENDDRDTLSGKTIHNPYDPANTPNGVLIFDTYKMPLRGKDGEIIGMLGISRDITESKKAENALRESNERYRNLFMANIDGMLVADAATRKFRYANPAICRMLGYSEEELTQMSMADIHPKESLERVIAEFEAQTSSGAMVTAKDLQCIKKDGQVISVSINIVPVMINQTKYMLGIFRDTTGCKSREKRN